MEDVVMDIRSSVECLREVADTLNTASSLVEEAGSTRMIGDSPTASKLYKAGLGFMFLVPVPVVSEAAGSILIVLGKILSERAKKPVDLKLGETLDTILEAARDIWGV